MIQELTSDSTGKDGLEGGQCALVGLLRPKHNRARLFEAVRGGSARFYARRSIFESTDKR